MTSQGEFLQAGNMAVFIMLSWTLLYVMVLSYRYVIAIKQIKEPICTSRFDYEHKMVHNIVMLEIEQNKVKALVGKVSKLQAAMKEVSLQYRAKVDRIEKKLKEVEANRPFQRTGTTYVRWGRTTCPENGTEIVYKGYAGGGYYNNKGSAANYLCLPEKPVWGVYEDSEQTAGTVYGAEYELYGRDMNNFFGKTLHNHEVPCCVCRTKRPSVIMLPGRNICYDGWTLEYSGYLTSDHESHHATEFVCLDGDPEVTTGGSADVNGKLFYFVEARCGSLPCPPYVNGRELTCAVCSK